MKRLLALTVLVLGTAACGSAGPTIAPDAAPAVTPAATPAPVVTDAAPESSAAVADETQARTIALPPPSGDPELDALGAELDGLSEELAALDSATDSQGNP